MQQEPRPFYASPDGAITVYNERWEDVVAADLVPFRDIALVHADPVYGLGEQAHRPGRLFGRSTKTRTGKAREYPRLHGNDKPFSPSPLLALDRPLVTWGANHYASRLPDSPSWLIWDKREDSTPDDGSDAELAWTNIGGALRTFRHTWRGLARASEGGAVHLHPTQKPVALSVWLFTERAKLKPGSLVFVPFLGSGPDLAAAVKCGMRVIACDVERWCCEVAVSARLGVVPPGVDRGACEVVKDGPQALLFSR